MDFRNEVVVIFPDDVLISKQFVFLRHLAKLAITNLDCSIRLKEIVGEATTMDDLARCLQSRKEYTLITKSDIKMMSGITETIVTKSITSKLVKSLNDVLCPHQNMIIVDDGGTRSIVTNNVEAIGKFTFVKPDEILDRVMMMNCALVNFVVSTPHDLVKARELSTMINQSGIKSAGVIMVDDHVYNKKMKPGFIISKVNLW